MIQRLFFDRVKGDRGKPPGEGKRRLALYDPADAAQAPGAVLYAAGMGAQAADKAGSLSRSPGKKQRTH